MKCVACNNELVLVRGKCKCCGIFLKDCVNQVSGMNEKAFKCTCGSSNIYFCNIYGSLRCRKCKRSLTYEEATSWT